MTSRLVFWVLNVVGGSAVLGSYVWGFVRHRTEMPAMWGGVPNSWRPIYVVSMFAAAFGYLAMVAYVHRAGSSFAPSTWRSINLALLLVLVASTLWLPLTLRYVNVPTSWSWMAIRLVLWTVALGSLWLLVTIAKSAETSRGLQLAATIGLLLFAFHTTVLDAAVWPAKFPLQHKTDQPN